MARESGSDVDIATPRQLAALQWLRGRGWLIALCGALAATCGDFAQLWMVNAARPALALPVPPAWLVVPATLLGTLGIPLYAIGYYVRAHRARGRAPLAAACVALGGAAGAVLGGAVHAMTGVQIANNVGGIVGGLEPLAGLFAGGPVVVSLWSLCAASIVVAGIAEALLPQAAASRPFNPLVAIVGVSVLAALMPLPWSDIVGPASLNIAHVVFFARLGLLD